MESHLARFLVFDDQDTKNRVTCAFMNCLMTNSSLKLFDNAFEIIKILENYDKKNEENEKNNTRDKLSELRKFRSGNKVTFPRLSLIDQINEYLIKPILEYVSKYHVQQVDSINRPPLYEFGENVEILKRLTPYLFKSTGKPCMLMEDVKTMVKLEDFKLIEELGMDHPLFLKLREVKEFLRPLDKLNDFISLDKAESSRHLVVDERAVLILESIVAWYKIILSLSCAYDRHCKYCEIFPGEIKIQGSYDIDNIINHHDFDGLPDVIKNSLKRMQNLCARLLTLKESLSSPISTINLIMANVLEEVSELEEGLQETSPSPFLSWWITWIKIGLKDLKHYFMVIKEILDDYYEAFEQLDSESLQDKGIDILWSITLEEIYDLGGTIAHFPRRRILPKKSRHESFPIELFDEKNLKKLRRNLFKRKYNKASKTLRQDSPTSTRNLPDIAKKSDTPLKPPIFKSDEERQIYFRRVYAHFSKNLSIVPYSLKRKLFDKTIRTLQNRLSLGCAASLLDAYFGSGLFFNRFLPILLLLPGAFLLLTILPFERPLKLPFVSIYLSKWEFLTVTLGIWALALLVFLLSKSWWQIRFSGRKYIYGKETTPNLALGQLLSSFVVPMALALSPFVLSDELKTFVYRDIDKRILFVTWFLVFLVFSLFAIWKLQSPLQQKRIRNMLRILVTLWPQALIFSFFMPILLQNPKEVVSKACIKLVEIGSSVIQIPRIEYITFRNLTLKVFPAPSLIFSVLCLFVAVFLEGFYRRR